MRKKSIVNYFVFNSVIIILIILTFFSFFIYYSNIQEQDNNREIYRKEITELYKKKLIKNVSNLKESFKIQREYSFNQLKTSLVNDIYAAIEIYNKIEKTLKFNNNDMILLKDLLKAISSNNIRLYFFAHKTDGTILFNENNINNKAINIKNLDNTKEYYYKQKELLKHKNEGFIEYYWNRPGENKKIKKLSFIKKIPNTDIIIGIGEYLDDFNISVRANLLFYLRSMKNNEDFDSFIINSEGKIINHNKPHFNGFYIKNIKSDPDVFFKKINEVLKSKKGIFFKDKYISVNSEKYSYRYIFADYYEETDWILCSYIDTSIINKQIDNKIYSLKKEFNFYFINIITISILFIVLCIILIKAFSKKTGDYFHDFLVFFRESLIKSEKIDLNNIRYTEFVPLAEYSNDLIDKLNNKTNFLTESQKRYELSQKIGKFAHWELNIDTKEYIFSKEFRKLMGFNDDEDITPKKMLDLIHVDDKENAIKITKDGIDSKTGWKIQFRIIKNKKIRWIEEISDYIKLNKDSDKIIGVVYDITQNKERELAILAAKNKAQNADRIKSEFLANMSHEVRTPLTSILGFSDILIKDPKNKNIEKYLKNIKNSSIYLSSIIDDIIDISKIESGQINVKKDYVRIYSIIEDIASIFIKKKKDDVSFSVIRDIPETKIIYIDPIRTKQIIINILSNAFKFTQKGKIIFKTFIEEDEIIFSIEDSGPGIEKKDFPLIFEKFRQVDSSITRNYGGLGLGLAISKTLCDLLNYNINVSSKINKGTTFQIRIPDITPLKNDNKYLNTDKKNIENFDLNILVVEDNLENNDLIVLFLKQHFKNIYSAYNGKDALDIIKNNKIDIIFTDIQMTPINGIELLKITKINFPEIYVVAITAHAMSDDKEKYIETGFDDYLSKPFTSDVLYNKIKDLLNKKSKK